MIKETNTWYIWIYECTVKTWLAPRGFYL